MAKKKRTGNPHRRTRRSARRQAFCICESIFHGLYIGLDSACRVLAHLLLAGEIYERRRGSDERCRKSVRGTYTVNRYGSYNQKGGRVYPREDEDEDGDYYQ